jgi:hypothetical protein
MDFIVMGAASRCGSAFDELKGRPDYFRDLLSKTNSWRADFFFELEKAVDAFSDLHVSSGACHTSRIESMECALAFLGSMERNRPALSKQASGAAILDAVSKLREGFDNAVASLFIYCCNRLESEQDKELFESQCDRCLTILKNLVRLSPDACDAICKSLTEQISAINASSESGAKSLENLSSVVHHLTTNGTESFVYVLMTHGILNQHDAGESCKQLLAKLLHFMCIGPASIVTGVCYHHCLYPLQLILWRYRTDAVSSVADDFVTELSNFCDKLLQSCALVLFSSSLEQADEEEALSVSLTVEDIRLVQSDYEKAIVMGIFHAAPEVRREACMRAAHYFKLSLARRAAAFARYDDPYILFDCDAFMNLVSLEGTVPANNFVHSTDKRTLVSLGDLGNLSRIAFRSRPEFDSPTRAKFVIEDDFRIRITAIDQVAQALISDPALADAVSNENSASLRSKPGAIGWASATAQSCVYMIDQLVAFLHGSPSYFTSETPIGDDQCVRLISGCIHLLYVIISKVQSVRDALTFRSLNDLAPNDIGCVICAHTVLKIAIIGARTVLGIPSSLSRESSTHQDAERLRFHSLALLCIWSIDSGDDATTGVVTPKAWVLRHLRAIEATKTERIDDCTQPSTVIHLCVSETSLIATPEGESSSTARFAALPAMLIREQFTPGACVRE